MFDPINNRPIRGRWKFDEKTKKMVPYEPPPKPEVNAPYVITDEIPGGIRSMADRKTYTSKRKLRDSYRRLGYVEVGNEVEALRARAEKRDPDPKYEENLEADLEQAYTDIREGNAELSELDKERCKIINKQFKENLSVRELDEAGNPRD